MATRTPAVAPRPHAPPSPRWWRGRRTRTRTPTAGQHPPRPLGAPPQAEPAPRQRTRMNTTATVAPPQAHPPAAGRCQQPNKRPRKPLRPLTTGRSRAKSPRATATSPLTDRKRISSMRARRTSAEQRATGAPTESQ